MVIQWFPGHMYKTKKDIISRLNNIDIVVEILDARAPYSCTSPLLDSISEGKLKIKILNKADLADFNKTNRWISYFNNIKSTTAYATDSINNRTIKKKFINMCKQLVPHKNSFYNPLRVLVCGVPNVGKSTFINNLVGKKYAKTGNEPGITKNEQRIILSDDFWLYDTSGMLWEKIDSKETGIHLAIIGSVGVRAFDAYEVVLELLEYLKLKYFDNLVRRYKLDDVQSKVIDTSCLLNEIAIKRGAILFDNKIDFNKIAKIILNDFRNGKLGKITLEDPKFSLYVKNKL